MGLPDNYFREKNPAAIVAKVAEVTLAVISQWDERELKRVGWLDNSIVDKLYKLGSTGVWLASEQLSNGVYPTDKVLQICNIMAAPAIGVSEYNEQNLGTAGPARKIHKRIGILDVTTDGAGAAANQVLVPAVASYKGRVEIISILPDSTDAATTLNFQDEDDTGLTGGIPNIALNLTASTRNTQLQGCIFYSPTANKALEVDVAGYAATSHLIIQYYYFYEE